MAKLVDVYRSDRPLGRRQLPLVVDENLTMVMDLNFMGLVCDNKPIKGKELEEFSRKVMLLSPAELTTSLQVTKSDMLRVLNQAVPCVGCRRSVERLYYQLFKCGHPTTDPLTVTKDGIITLRADRPVTAVSLGTLFHGHSTRLNNLVDSQPRRSKKSHRCLLHSLDSQRSRPITPAWREVWECMRPQCKEEVVLIESATLHITLENYLRKHRFCGECRTKVQRAYTLLVEEPEPCKEKGYVSALYSGIKRCLPDKHLHLQTKTDYISKLISRAEPELMGRYDIRRERHAKTLEIAQEEVLTCLGICVYERLHRIYVRMREEECTCQVFAAVAVETLCRSFETAVEKKQGISQLELLYEELTKEEQLKKQRKEQKKLKRRRKKERMADEKENCTRCITPVDSEIEKCACVMLNSKRDKNDKVVCCSKCCGNSNHTLMKPECSNQPSKVCTCTSSSSIATKKDQTNCSLCVPQICANCLCFSDKSKSLNNNASKPKTHEKTSWYDNETTNCKCGLSKKKSKLPKDSHFNCDFDDSDLSDPLPNNKPLLGVKPQKETWSSSEHSHDCGYSSVDGCCETGSGTSSLPSSPDGSELACSGSCCNIEAECTKSANDSRSKFFPKENSIKLGLQQMLEDSSSDDDGEGCYISPEEVKEFQTKFGSNPKQREELRQTLRKRFAQLCVNGGPNIQMKNNTNSQ